MKKYRMTVPFAGFVEVTVEADFPAEAEEKFCLMNLEKHFNFHDSRVERFDFLFLDLTADQVQELRNWINTQSCTQKHPNEKRD